MSDQHGVNDLRTKLLEPGSPAWWVVCSRELRDLWIGGKALHLILIYTILLGVYSFLLASNAEGNLMSIRAVVLEMVKASIAVGLFISLIIGADTISGERERATLEGLLLTPAGRTQIVVGKFLAAVSPWPVALAIAIPYWVVLSRGDAVFGQAVIWGVVLGTLLAPALAGVGMLVSLLSKSNKTSMLVSLCLFLLIILPIELTRPGKVMTAFEIRRAAFYDLVNPWSATSRFLGKVLVDNLPLGEVWFFLLLPVVFTAFVLVLLFMYARRGLRLDAETASRVRSFWARLRRAVSSSVPRLASSHNPKEPERGQPEDVLIQPTVEAHPRSVHQRVAVSRVEASGSASPTWWVVFRRELRDQWIGGKALILTLFYTVVLGGYSYLMAQESTLSMIPPQEMVFELLKAAIVASVFVGLIIGADSLSGERERATLESLLLTPASRRQIVVGKFLAAVSPWPVALAIVIPYMNVLSQGDAVFVPAVLWGAVLGSVLTPAFTALGMFVGFWCNNNKTSMFVSLCLYLLFLLPTQLPGHAQIGTMGSLLQWANPMAAPRHFLAALLVNNRTLAEFWTWLFSPVAFAILVFLLLFWYASPGLRLEGGKAGRLLWFRRRAASLAMIACIVGSLSAFPTMAQTAAPQSEQGAAKSPEQQPLQIAIDVGAKVVKAGTPVLYNTVLTNNGTAASPPLIVAMNIINLNAKGEIVDPEDWSPQRTQYIDSLAAGKSVNLSWRVNAILDGDYMVYMVLVPAPSGQEATSQPVASSGIHLTVTPFTRLNPGGVLPYAIGGPVVLGLVIFLVYRHRRRKTDEGGA